MCHSVAYRFTLNFRRQMDRERPRVGANYKKKKKMLREILNTFIVNYVPKTPLLGPTGKAYPRILLKCTNIFLHKLLTYCS